jgi:hypothetical protein
MIQKKDDIINSKKIQNEVCIDFINKKKQVLSKVLVKEKRIG